MPSLWSQDIYVKAFRFAEEAHLGQEFRGTKLPYTFHVTLVCMETIAALAHESERNGDLAIQCALLHDVIEDTPIGYASIQAEFGTTVADGVLALTKNETLPKTQQMPDSLARILKEPREVAMVKLADRITNLMPPPHDWHPEAIKTYHAEALRIHAMLGSASNHLAERLLMKADQYQRYF
jgi:(p)ppGpp synthase/HD superfamily hydrolase